MDPHEQDDEALMAELRRIVADADPVPDTVVAAARAAFETRDLDRDLAELVADSAAADAGFETVRQTPGSQAAGRLLSFDGGGVRVEMEVTRTGDDLTLIGQLDGVAGTSCDLERGGGHRTAIELDELGRFLVTGLPPGPLRLRCRSAGGAEVVTVWITL
jgi:hypothetical protein